MPLPFGTPFKPGPNAKKNWGNPPWEVTFHPGAQALPDSVDFAVIGAGFAGCAAAAWLKHAAPKKGILLLEADRIGAGASGHTGGTALPGSAGGDLPGLGDVLRGLAEILRNLKVDADLELPGAFELEHGRDNPESPIHWQDSGLLCALREEEGGSLDPGKMLSGLAKYAHDRGAIVSENSRVTDIEFGRTLRVSVGKNQIVAKRILITTNATSLELSGLERRGSPKFTLAVATQPLTKTQLKELGLESRKVFYTEDLPYLWGRLLPDDSVIFGAGLVHVDDWLDLDGIDVNSGETARLFETLEKRVHGFHPVLRDIKITRRWGGPILFADNWVPVFEHHPKSERVIILGAFSGHGVALSVYLGKWAAQAMLGKRKLPRWKNVKVEEW
jgi:glycine/D-amino acid oxidase-like deaminating enzyme